ncbi:hypothetical protein B0J13DRAFT_562647 [Dactylonectria estremocensis]|uniref:Uncharacterized protein n=1 Tax=Dactylonectria estremocensis TaxID=1079267 RepID=A0A9P9E3V1_9HYPO|nr:hypothetical protein B0J13DRAFT_562647 [Dactylonectria estremocensis]
MPKMPSTTAFFGSLVTNLGPLTTTVTLPASCATATNQLYYGNNRTLGAISGVPTCGYTGFGDCLPSASDFDSLVSKGYETATQGFLHYFSPGVVCPSGWTTAGTLAHAEKTGSFELSGVFTQDPYVYDVEDLPSRALPGGKAWQEVLGESETLALCCPSGYSGHINGGCWSSLGPRQEFGYSSVCWIFYPEGVIATVNTLDGSTWDPPLISISPVTERFMTRVEAISTTSGGTYTDDWDILTMVPAIPLVFQATDTASVDSDDENDAEDSAASSFLPGPSPLQLLNVLASMLAGAGLFVFW